MLCVYIGGRHKWGPYRWWQWLTSHAVMNTVHCIIPIAISNTVPYVLIITINHALRPYNIAHFRRGVIHYARHATGISCLIRKSGFDKTNPWYIKYVVGRLPLQNIHSVTMHNIPPGIIRLCRMWFDTCCIIFLDIGYSAFEPLQTAYRSDSCSVVILFN